MAGGIDWYRAHHGTVEDPKLGLVAKCAGQRRGDVIAMWHYLMEKASSAEERGNPGVPHFRSLDFLLDLAPGSAERIYTEFVAEALVDGTTGRLTAWDKRQPKRERPEDDTAAQRKRDQRAREAAAAQPEPPPANPEKVTPGHATSHQKTPRGEERREEPSSPASKKSARAAPPPVERPAEVDEAVWRDWLALRKAKKATVSPTVLDGAMAEAAKAGMSLEAFLRVWCMRGTHGLQADWLKPHERPQQTSAAIREPAWRSEQRQRTAEFAGPYAARQALSQPPTEDSHGIAIGMD